MSRNVSKRGVGTGDSEVGYVELDGGKESCIHMTRVSRRLLTHARTLGRSRTVGGLARSAMSSAFIATYIEDCSPNPLFRNCDHDAQR